MDYYMEIDIRDRNTMEHLEERESPGGQWEEFKEEVEFELNLIGMSGPPGDTLHRPLPTTTTKEHMAHLRSK